MAAVKRMAQLGVTSANLLTKLLRFSIHSGRGGFESHLHSGINRFDCRHVSHLADGKRLFVVDTLAMARRLEAKGLSSKQAEATTSAITELLDEHVAYSFDSNTEMQKVRNLEAKGVPSKQAEALIDAITQLSGEHVAHSTYSKAEMQKNKIGQESNFLELQSEEKSYDSEEDRFSSLQREVEELRSSLEKIRGELRDESDKSVATILREIGALGAKVTAHFVRAPTVQRLPRRPCDARRHPRPKKPSKTLPRITYSIQN